MSNLYKIYSISITNFLVRQGNDIYSVEDSPNDPTGRLKVFLFKDTPKLRSDMSKYRKE